MLRRVKRILYEIMPDTVNLGFKINRKAQRLAEASTTEGMSLLMQGFCTAIAIGSGDASRPHLDKNDDPYMPTAIIHLAGPPGYLVFPQLGKVRHSIGDVIIAPTSSLVHYSMNKLAEPGERVTAVCFSCRHIHNAKEILKEVGEENTFEMEK